MFINKISSKQSEVYFYKDTVRKKYFDETRHLKEYKSLSEANKFYVPFSKGGWAYELVDVLNASENEGIVMKKVSGIPMREDPDFDIKYYYHAGCWLGNFHQLSINKGIVKTFSDYGLPNIMICNKTKTITGIDLGEGALKLRSYYYDILHFLCGTITSHISRKTIYNTKCVEQFLKGYNERCEFLYRESLFKENLSLILERWSNPKRKKRLGIVKFYLGKMMLFYYIQFSLKKTLRKMG